MLLAFHPTAQPGGSAETEQPCEWHGHADPDVIPEQRTEPCCSSAGNKANNKDADALLRDPLPEQQSCAGEADHQQQVAPARHQPTPLKASVALVHQGGQPVGMHLHARNREQAFTTIESGVRHFEEIAQGGCCAADQHDAVPKHGFRHLTIDHLGQGVGRVAARVAKAQQSLQPKPCIDFVVITPTIRR